MRPSIPGESTPDERNAEAVRRFLEKQREAAKISSTTPTLPTMPTKSRMVVVETISHQSASGQPTQIDQRYSRWLENDEQPYVRRAKIGKDWQALDIGWFKPEDVVFIHVTNEEGKRLPVQLNEEEKKLLQQRIIQIGVSNGKDVTPFCQIRPGEAHYVHVIKVDLLRIRCLSSEARHTLTIFPS